MRAVIRCFLLPLALGCSPAAGDACDDEQTCPDGMECVERPDGAATRAGPECAIPCASDEECPLGDCAFPYTHRWLTCLDDGHCAAESACE